MDSLQTISMSVRLIHDIETNDTVIYLGAKITNRGWSEPEIRRIGLAKDILGKPVKTGNGHNIRRMTKMRLVKARIFSIAT